MYDAFIVNAMKNTATRVEWSLSFLEVVEQGSFTNAAERIGCSKAYLSKQIRQLEEALGLKLLHRSTRRIDPTNAGMTYLTYCRQLRETLDEAERAVSSARESLRGQVRISVPTTFGTEFMTGFLVSMHQQYPDLDIAIDLSNDHRDLLSERYDLALRFSRNVVEHLIAKPLGSIQDWIVASPEFFRNPNLPAHPDELGSLPCLSNSHYQSEHEWLFMHEQTPPVKVAARHWAQINNYPLIRQATLRGLGVARLPAFMVAKDVAEGSLIRLLPDWTLKTRPVYLVFPDLRPLPHKVRILIDCFRSWYLSLDRGPE